MNAKTPRLFGIAISLLAAALLIAACGSAPEPATPSTAAEPTQPAAESTEPLTPTEAPEPTTAQAAQTQEGEVLFPPETPSAVRGKVIFTANCAACHGAAGDGSGLAGAANFTDLEFMRHEKPAEFFAAIRDGVEGTTMPAWGETLSEMDIWDVLYYERTFATSPETVAQGQALFTANCVACHGQAGDGSALQGAADFTDQEFMSNEDPAEFFEAVTDGVEGSAMPAWGATFDEEEIWSLIDYVWTFAYEYPKEAAPEPEPTAIEPTAAPEAEAPSPQGMPSAVRGKAVFTANCIACHGEAGDGSSLQGAADFTDLEFMRHEKPSEFFAAIRDGVGGTAMPAWGETLSEAEIWDVLYYEWTFATSPEEIAQGQDLFAANCITCHGQAGDGSGLAGAANFTDREFMDNEDPAEFFEAIATGINGSAMPSWGDILDEDQIWSLVNYLWTFAYEYPEAVEAEPMPEIELPEEPDPAVGAKIWQQKPCIGCHGAEAEGDIGPKLAGTPLEFDEALLRVRVGKAPMPAFSEAQISDLELQHIFAWFKSLTPPTPTPGPTDTPPPASSGPTATPKPALPPSGHLMAFWEHVNWVKVHSDFAKDGTPDLASLQDRVRQAKERGNGALQEADLAIADIPNPQAQNTIREVKGFINEILGHADAALATQDLNTARSEAGKMVEISRLDAWPLASQAVKQAGFTGSVLVRVKNQNGSPLAGALVTALTAPTPSGGQTDANGQVLMPDLAAVRVMQVKAYKEGLVYHEVNVTVPQGGRAVADITLPGPPTGGVSPVVANASINPASGPGNAQVTFRMTGTDPQGHANIAEDQVFALNPELGNAYILRSAGGDNWEETVDLPNLGPGTHTWYFFIVDHQCNTSNVVPLTYTVQ